MVTIFIPLGSVGPMSVILCLTRSITFCASSPKRMMTTPPTTSPWPSSSATPRRMSGPKVTVARSFTSTGVPVCEFDMTTMLPMSSSDLMYPRPRTIYSRPDISTNRAPTSLLLFPIASTTILIGIL